MIKFLDLHLVNQLHAADIEAAVSRVMASGWYLLGEENRLFEQEYSAFTGTQHCVGCGNGLDALTLIYRAYLELGMMKAGDEVIVPANTYIASILAITENGLKPVLAEPDPETLEIDPARLPCLITPRTRSLLLVHLYGRNAYTEEIGLLCRDHGLLLVEDNAQAHGCRTADGRRTGSLGHAAGHSFYPGKNLGALGDGGAVTTSDAALAEAVRTLANYGSQRKYVFRYRGRNSRLDELQAAVLRAKLPHLDDDNARRHDIAQTYLKNLNNPLVSIPKALPQGQNVWHIFPILCQRRDALQEHLRQHGVQTLIHYPIPPHQQECYSGWWPDAALPITERIHREELSLPISPAMSRDEALAVTEAVNSFTIER